MFLSELTCCVTRFRVCSVPSRSGGAAPHALLVSGQLRHAAQAPGTVSRHGRVGELGHAVRHVISPVARSVLLLVLLVLLLMVLVLLVLMLRALCRRRRRRLPVSALHARKLLKAALLQRAQDVAHGERRGVFRAQGHDSAPRAPRDEDALALRQPDTTNEERGRKEKKVPAAVMTVMVRCMWSPECRVKMLQAKRRAENKSRLYLTAWFVTAREAYDKHWRRSNRKLKKKKMMADQSHHC